jgi:DNA-binding transcriptional MerR regulator
MIKRVKIEEAARITGVPPGTLRFWRATDQGPRSYVVGRRLWYDVEDLQHWLDAQKAHTARGGDEQVPPVASIPDITGPA